MEQNLRQTLQNTINPDNAVRNEAENQLEDAGKNPECMFIIKTVLMKDINALLKQISSLFFVNALRKNWKEPSMAAFTGELEAQILELLEISDPQALCSYLEVIQIILDNIQDKNFEHLFKKLSFFLGSAERRKNIAALHLIMGIFKNENLKYSLEDSLSAIFNANGPVFTQLLAQSLAGSDFEVARMCMKIVGRSYTYYSIPDYLSRLDVFRNYVYTAIEITKIPFSHDKDVSKLKKWATFFLYKCTSKGFRKYFKNSDFIAYMKECEIVNVLVERFFSIVTDYAARKPIHARVLTYMCDFLVLLSDNKHTKPVVRDNYGFLLTTFILPVLSYDDRMRELFETDEERYLSIRYNLISSDLHSGVSSLFSNILSCDKTTKADVIALLTGFLKNRKAPNYLAYRYAVIGLLANEQRILQKMIGTESYEHFIVNEIFADLKSDHDFLISQALYFLSLAENNAVSPVISLEAFKAIFELASKSEEAVLSVEAALSTNFFIQNEGLFETLKPVVPKIFTLIIMFSRKYMLESLSSLMNILIENYPEEIAIVAPQLAESICSNVLELVESKEDNKIASVSGFMTTLDKLILNADTQRETVQKIYSSASKVIYTIFVKKIEDFYQEAFDLMNSFLYSIQGICADMMVIFASALSIGPEDISFYPREVMDFVDNFLSYGKASIVNPQTLELIYNTIDVFIPSVESADDDLYDEDFEVGCRIADSLMLNAGLAHSMNPQIVPCLVNKMVMKYKQCIDSTYLDVLALEVMMNCFAVAPKATLSSFGAFLPSFFSELGSKHAKFKRVHDKKVFVVFIGALYEYSADLDVDCGSINAAFVNVFHSLPEAIKKRNKLREEEDRDENMEDDDGNYEDDNDASCDESYDHLEEDIWFETDLDRFDAYAYVRGMLTSPRPGSYGAVAISKMSQQQVLAINEILSATQEQQK